ncbi:MAG: lipid A deacylase LpxR family protein [Sulfuricaulis sp.]|uniref:lipid A deacylase LpxR family protein n=1 Tax=Sulfuricaulis sp. TaxID=2003553 RepID=UPI003C4CF313
MTTTMKLAFIALIASSAVGCVTQSAGTHDGAFTFTLENDVLTNSDNNYTNGVGATWVSNELNTYDDERFIKKWGKFWSFLPGITDDGSNTYAAWSIVQEMHTPDDIDNPNPPASDQPYAGILYVDNVLYARNGRWTHAWELKLGVVGPASQAEDVQKKFHELIGGNEPMGWDTQLPNEPVINVGYTAGYVWREGKAGEAAEWRLIPIGNVSLGTYFTGVGLGVYGEIGWNLVKAMATTSLREGFNAASTVGVGPVHGWSESFFGGLGGFGVVHYLPLDGTVFRDSRSVDTKPFVGTASLGFAVRHEGWVVSLAATFTTDAFETQQKAAEFGTLSVSWFF